MKARALLIEALVGIASAAVAAGAFCWMARGHQNSDTLRDANKC